MRVAVASDHAGLPIKDAVLETLASLGCDFEYLGTESTESVDFPDFAERVGRKLQAGEADRGIVLCGSGVGVCIAANKMTGIRAAIAHDTFSAHQGVEHDSMNVLCLGGRIIGVALAAELVTAFVRAEFQEEDRFVRRLNKILALEEEGLGKP